MALGWQPQAAADEVTLKTKDGAFEIKGELLSAEDGFLTVQSPMGRVRIPIDQVTCTGPGCPDSMRPSTGGITSTGKGNGEGPRNPTDLVVGIAANLPQDLIGRLIAAYEGVEGVSVETAPEGRSWTITNASGSFLLAQGDAGDGDLRIEIAESMDDPDIRKVLALDAIVVVTAPGSRPNALSIQDLVAIYSGSATDWTALKTRGGQIVPVLPEADPAVLGVLRSAVLTGAAPAETVTRAKDIPGFLLSTPGSIAMVRASSLAGLRPTPISGACGLTSSVGAFTVKSGQYPLVRPVVVRAGGGALAPPVQDFLDFAATDRGQVAVGTVGLVGQSIIRSSDEWRSDWIASAAKLSEFIGGGTAARQLLQELIDLTANASRLSVTLRYAFGKDAPDIVAKGDFSRLAAAIDSGAYDGSEILFIGYTDAGTAPTEGRAASSTAANRVLRDFATAHPAVLKRPGLKLSSTGYGGVAPLICSGTESGRAVNQRVEVWIRPL